MVFCEFDWMTVGISFVLQYTGGGKGTRIEGVEWNDAFVGQWSCRYHGNHSFGESHWGIWRVTCGELNGRPVVICVIRMY